MRPTLFVLAATAISAGLSLPARDLAAQQSSGRVQIRQPASRGTDTVVLRTITSGNEAEVLRVVNELRAREARILQALSEVPFDRPDERRQLEEELARISREAFSVISVIESRCLEEKATAPAGYLGVNITSEVQVRDRLVSVHRSTITSVEPGSPAERAGVQAGDRLLSIAGRDARERLPELAGVLEPGRRIAVRVEREGAEREFQVDVAPRPQRWDPGCPRFERAIQPLRMGGVARFWVRDSTDRDGNRFVFISKPEGAHTVAVAPVVPPVPSARGSVRAGAATSAPTTPATPATPAAPPAAPSPAAPMVFAYGTSSGGASAIGYFAGAQFRALDDDWRGVLGLRAGTDGVLVNEVAPGSPAAAAGLRVGDVVTSVNGTAATSPLVVVRLLGLDEDQEAALRVIRTRNTRSVTFRWGGGR